MQTAPSRRLLSALFFAGLLATGLVIASAAAQNSPPRPRPGAAPAEPPSVNRSMKGMARALRELKDQAADPSMTADSLRLIGEFQRSLVAAKSQSVPDDLLAQAATPADKERLSKEFRAELIKALRLALDLESDILEGRHAAAAAKCADIITLRDHAHEEMGVEEE
jgi:hypothetical protein